MQRLRMLRVSSDDRLTILFMTYNRMVYADPCLRAVIEGVRWDGDLHIHIADDGSPAGYVDCLRTIASGYDKVSTVGATNSERGGYGRNFNLATQCIHPAGGLVLCVEDDWRLTRPLDVAHLARVFKDAGIGCLRLGYLGATQALDATLVWMCGQALWMLHADSAEPHVWAGHPRLETVEWQREQGAWYEGYDPNITEFMMAHQMRARIAWPAWLPAEGGLFEHIGSERAR